MLPVAPEKRYRRCEVDFSAIHDKAMAEVKQLMKQGYQFDLVATMDQIVELAVIRELVKAGFDIRKPWRAWDNPANFNRIFKQEID